MKIEGIPPHIPPVRPFDTGVNHAPVRKDLLTKEEKKLALANALRYFPPAQHELLAEFARTQGIRTHIYVSVQARGPHYGWQHR